jgi:hypothetical protein
MNQNSNFFSCANLIPKSEPKMCPPDTLQAVFVLRDLLKKIETIYAKISFFLGNNLTVDLLRLRHF